MTAMANRNDCPHLAAYKKTPHGSTSYRIIHASFVAPKSAEARCEKVSATPMVIRSPAASADCHRPQAKTGCFVCNTATPRLHACLNCIYFGCYTSGHIHEHSKANQHYLGTSTRPPAARLIVIVSFRPAMELQYGSIYCFQCQDYVYDKELEAGTDDEKKHIWEPTKQDMELLRKNPKRKRIYENSFVGEFADVCNCAP